MFSRDATSFFMNDSSLGGASGSPVVDTKKQVVGVLFASNFNLVQSVNLNDLQVFVQRGLRNKPRKYPRQVVKREIQNLKNLANQKNASAQFRLGMMYYEGMGVIQNFEKAENLLKQAAEQGHALAQYNLAVMYYEGKGVTQNFERAAHRYKQAAEKGLALAQYNLAGMYGQGKGVTQNFEKAADLLKQAAEKGHTEAQVMLESLLNNM